MNGFKISDPLVPARLIQGGGPPRDGIPSIDAPRFVAADVAKNISATDRVLGLHVNNIAKAYPIRILNHHEIVNDRFATMPVAITFCPLCGTGIAFDAVVDGKARKFGVSGLLYNSDVLMYDRETESLWSQILGKAVNGPSKGQAPRRAAFVPTQLRCRSVPRLRRFKENLVSRREPRPALSGQVSRYRCSDRRPGTRLAVRRTTTGAAGADHTRGRCCSYNRLRPCNPRGPPDECRR